VWALYITIQTSIIDIHSALSTWLNDQCHQGARRTSTHLYQFLAARITGIQFNRSVSLEFGAEVGTRSFPDSRRSSDEDGAENVHTVLARLFEASLQAIRPLIEEKQKPI
jgi:hypothetical protein